MPPPTGLSTADVKSPAKKAASTASSAASVPLTAMALPDSLALTVLSPATGPIATVAPAPVKFQVVASVMPA